MIMVKDVRDLANLKGKVIEFTKKIEDWECYAEQYMRARVVGYRYNAHNDTAPEDQVHELHFDYAEFDDYNQKFEQSNYYDKYGKPRLTAREANYYKPQEWIYFGNELPLTLVQQES